jgi:tRNA pseudouridine55 synthase
VLNGILNLDKPAGITSARAVNQVKRLLPRGTKIGHAGTLDPFATGVLLLLIGKATRLCESLMGAPKQYETTMKLGATTATDDLESPETPFHSEVQRVSRNDLARILPNFIGNIQQRPPIYSALKISGKRACDRVRAGEQVQLEPRLIQVYGIELLDFDWPHARLRIECGRGTYIRSLARDIGEALGVGGYLTALRRTRIGKYTIDQAIQADSIAARGVEQCLVSMETG